MSFELGNIKPANAEWKPQRIVVHGLRGVGKTRFGSTFDRPILAATEDGAGNIDIPTFPELAKSFEDMDAAIGALHGEHNFGTLVVDSLDWLEPYVWDKLVRKRPLTDKGEPVQNIEDYGFGKGFAMADEHWRYLLGGFDSLRLNKRMTIVLIAHTEVKTFKSPDSDPYDQYKIKLQNRASAIIQEWADMVLFANYETKILKTEVGFKKTISRGDGSGSRVVYTEHRPAFEAKNHNDLPPKIHIGQDKTWAGFHQALNTATGGRYELPGTTKSKGEKK